MKRSRFLEALAAGVLVLAAVRTPVFVDETEYAIVTQFGRPVRDLPGPGLHWTAPWQSVLRLDRRLQLYDPRPSEFLTREKKNLDLDLFVIWRIVQPRRFLETVIDMGGAEARLHDLVWSEMAAEAGRNPMEAFVSTNAAEHRLDRIVAAVAERCARRAAEAYGIEIADVRVKRVNLPAQVRENVFQRMRSERARIARQYRAEGEEEAMRIRAEADRERTVLLAQAAAEAEEVRGRAEAEATRIYAEAHRRDPVFYQLVRSLEGARRFLDRQTTLLLASDSPLLRHLFEAGAMAPESPR
ncbi:MAG: protease modulator HflC [Kiritimatiellae bacterium]|nr:protease modulator HflC [Kiritimatiellia bacterium]